MFAYIVYDPLMVLQGLWYEDCSGRWHGKYTVCKLWKKNDWDVYFKHFSLVYNWFLIQDPNHQYLWMGWDIRQIIKNMQNNAQMLVYYLI